MYLTPKKYKSRKLSTEDQTSILNTLHEDESVDSSRKEKISANISRTVSNVQIATVKSLKSMKIAADKSIKKGARDIKAKRNPCGIDCTLFAVFGILLLLMSTIAVAVSRQELIPQDLRRLDINGVIDNVAIPGTSNFYDITIPKDTLVAIFVADAGEGLDTTLTLLQRPSDVLVFNDDVSSDNKNGMLFFFAEDKDEDLIVDVRTLAGEGSFSLRAQVVEQLVTPEITFVTTLLVNDILLSTISLIPGTTYDIMAFENDFLFNEVDTAIRIREKDGTEILEVFQSSVSELTARTLFTPQSDGPFILEVREITPQFNIDLRVLVRSVQPKLVDIESLEASQIFDIHSQISTVLQFDVKVNTKYQLFFDVSIDNLPERNFLTGVEDEAGNALFFETSQIIPGVSLRLQDIFSNEVIKRGRTDLVENFRSEIFSDTVQTVYNVQLIPDPASVTATILEFTSMDSTTVLLDVSRWNPDYSFSSAESIDRSQNAIIGIFSIDAVFESDEIDEDELLLVDENNLYPACAIDQAKHTIDDDTCEQGIVLYCRNQFFPFLDTSEATKAAFQEICDCSTFLCATLPSGDDLDQNLQTFLGFFNGIFAVFCIIGIIIYIIAHADLFFYGGFNYWVMNNKGFSTWTLSACFLLASGIFFITQITLGREIGFMQEIANQFDINRIPVPTDELKYSYYDAIVEKIVDIYVENTEVDLDDNLFLNEAALKSIPEGKTFGRLQAEVNTNLVCGLFRDALAVIVFLDVSLVWLSSTHITQLNRERNRIRDRNIRIGIRTIEFVYFLALVIILAELLRTNGESYNSGQNYLTLVLSVLVVFVYGIGRYRLRYHFVTSRLANEKKQSSLWYLVRNVSSVVIMANVGIIIVQIFSLAKVRNFNELVEASNDSVAQTLFIFQDICIFTGQAAIFYYLFKSYLSYRASLFLEEESVNSSEREGSISKADIVPLSLENTDESNGLPKPETLGRKKNPLDAQINNDNEEEHISNLL